MLNEPKSEVLDFIANPYSAQKMAKIISSFGNTNGGALIFGLKEVLPTSNKIVGLSSDFHVTNTTKKAVSMLEPIPTVTNDWVSSGEKFVFIIKLKNQKRYIAC